MYKRVLLFISLISLLLLQSYAQESSTFYNSQVYVKPSWCVPLYSYTFWSTCLKGEQSRLRSDSNGCIIENSTQVRSCRLGYDEIEAKLANAKPLLITEKSSRFYLTNFEVFTESFTSTKNIEMSFIVRNEVNGEDFLARLVNDNEKMYFYTLELIDKEFLDAAILEEEGLYTKTLSDKFGIAYTTVRTDNSYKGVIFAFIGMFFLTFAMVIMFYFKKLNKNKVLTRLNEASTRKGIKTSEKELGKTYDDEKVKRYSKYIKEIKNFITHHPNESKEAIRFKLEKIGWNKDILDIVFKE